MAACRSLSDGQKASLVGTNSFYLVIVSRILMHVAGTLHIIYTPFSQHFNGIPSSSWFPLLLWKVSYRSSRHLFLGDLSILLLYIILWVFFCFCFFFQFSLWKSPATVFFFPLESYRASCARRLVISHKHGMRSMLPHLSFCLLPCTRHRIPHSGLYVS